MRDIRLTVPEMMFLVGTRMMLAGGVALLVASRFSREQRKFIGATLALIGAMSTIPAAIAVFGKKSDPEPIAEPEAVATKAADVTPVQPAPKPKRITRRVKLNTGEPQPKQD